jgi:hypothetical protein
MDARREKTLSLLLKAPKKAVVNDIFVYVYDNRSGRGREEDAQVVAEKLGVSEAEGEAVGDF